MSVFSNTSFIALSCALGVALATPSLGQDSFSVDLTINDDDPTLPSNGNRNLEILQVTVTDPDAVRMTVSDSSHAGQHRIVLLPENYELSSATGSRNLRQLSRTSDAVAWAQVRGNGSAAIRDGGSADPLVAGQYQLYTLAETRRDATFGLMIDGARLGWGPSVDVQIATLSASSSATGRIVAVTAFGVARTQGQTSLTARNNAVSFTRVADAETGTLEVTQSTRDSVQMMGGLYTWIDLTGFRSEDTDGDRSYSGYGVQIGADMAISNDMVFGLSFGVQDLDSSVTTINQDGVLRFIQPYLAYSSGAWTGEASLIYGLGEYTQSSTGGTGDGETELWAITLAGGYEIDLVQGVTLTPMLGLARGAERVEGTGGTLAAAGSETVQFTQASLGAEFRHGNGANEIFAGFHADWLDTEADTTLTSDLLVDDGWTGRIEVGVSTEMANGLSLDTTFAISGLGGDLESTSGSLRFAFRF